MTKWRATRRAAGQRRLLTLTILMLGMSLFGCDADQGPDAVVHVVEVTPLTAVVQVGDTIELTARPKGPDGSIRQNEPVEWVSRDDDLAEIAANGRVARVAALKAGLAEINAGARGRIGVATLEIRNGVPSLAELVPTAVTAGGGDFTLIVRGARFAPGAQVMVGGTTRATQYVSTSELRAVITASDIATSGEHQVRVVNSAPGGGASEPLTLVVAPAGAAWVDVQPNTAAMPVGGTFTFAATARDAYGRDLELPLTWTSLDTGVATVAADGTVTGHRHGVAVIRATTAGGIAGSAVISVEGPATGIPVVTSISPDSVYSNPEGMEVIIEGLAFTGNSGAFLGGSGRPTEYVSPTQLKMSLWPGDLATAGTRTIRVFNPGEGGGMSAGVELRVLPGIWSVRAEPSSVELWPGQQRMVTATAYDEQNQPVTGHPVSWVAVDPAVATVDSEGRITAVSAGSTFVYATIGNHRAVVLVKVLAPVAWDVLYEGYHDGLAELWVLTPGPDAGPRRVLPAGTYAADPAYSAATARIAYVGMSWDGAMNIFTANRDGSDIRQLTATVALDEQPAWSRDGARIAFRSMRSGVSDIWVMNADGTSLVNVTRNGAREGGPWSAERPTWTPDGRLVFSFGPQNLNPVQYGLVRVNADGTGWTQLTDGSEIRDFEPEISPDGTLIAVRRQWGTSGPQLGIIRSDGSPLRWISQPGAGFTPSWSPDGEWLIFSWADGAGPAGSQIHMTGLHSWERRVLVPSHGRNPVWLPRN